MELKLSLSGDKKPTKVFANKRTMNFAYRKSPVNVKKLGIVLAIILVVVGLFSKFAIFDQLAKKNAALDARNSSQAILAGQKIGMSSYKELKEEYDRYSEARMNENERYLVDRIQVFDMIRDEVMPECIVDSVSLHNNELTLGISGLTLMEVSELTEHLKELEIVTQVELRNAYSQDSDIASMSIIIKLQKEGVVVEEA